MKNFPTDKIFEFVVLNPDDSEIIEKLRITRERQLKNIYLCKSFLPNVLSKKPMSI